MRSIKTILEGSFGDRDYYVTFGEKGVYYVIRARYREWDGREKDHLAQNLSTSNPDTAAKKIKAFETKMKKKVAGNPHSMTPAKKAAPVKIDPNEIPFGKHQGTKLEDVDDDYLLWLSGQTLRPSQRVKKAFIDRVKEEVKKRIGDPAELIPFGKHKGKKLSNVVQKDISYLLWMFDQSDYKNNPQSSTVYTPDFQANLEKVTKTARQKRDRGKKALEKKQGWLVDFLKQQGRFSNFASSIASDLGKGRKFGELPPKAREIVRDMWASRAGGESKGKLKKGSKNYQTHEKDFDGRIKKNRLNESIREVIQTILKETLSGSR